MGTPVFRDLNVMHDLNSIIWNKVSQTILSTCIAKPTHFNDYHSSSPISLFNELFPFQKCSLDHTTDEMI